MPALASLVTELRIFHPQMRWQKLLGPSLNVPFRIVSVTPPSRRRIAIGTMKETNRTAVTAYVAAQRHLRGQLKGAKTLTQMAAELGTTKTTVRRWLRRDHWELWMEHWASVDDIWQEIKCPRQFTIPSDDPLRASIVSSSKGDRMNSGGNPAERSEDQHENTRWPQGCRVPRDDT
jgi:hypothetical protein